ncbi:hypothetical protein [Deinococcus hopiensis]|uniref:hypothetical protein n=1 Tax=Deinococcus hopiensis TaxID=309885 RepID=UPI000A0218F8|nr:hypothetical protein [Deinococcus hopiensis]
MMGAAEALITRVKGANAPPSTGPPASTPRSACALPCGGEDLKQVIGRATRKVTDGAEALATIKDGNQLLPGEACGQTRRA